MIKIWGRANSSNVQKVLWCATELGVPFERYDAGGAFGGTDNEAYRRMNPAGLVPTLQDGDAFIWESNVIVRYLAARYGAGVLWPTDPAIRAEADAWMDWQQGTIGPAFLPIFMQLVRTPAERRDPGVVERANHETGRLFQQLEDRLSGRDYVLGQEFSMGDIPVGIIAHRWLTLIGDRPARPQIEAWYARLRQRPAFARTVLIPLT